MPKKISTQTEIVGKYLSFLDQHIEDVIEGKCAEFLELNQIAELLHVSHAYLTELVQKELGNHPCHFYDDKIVGHAKKMLRNRQKTIADIAYSLTYDPSNFSKFFKKWTGETPNQYRKKMLQFDKP